MRINEKIAIGLFKEQIIGILIEDNSKKQGVLFDKLTDEMLKSIVPVRQARNENGITSINTSATKNRATEA
jgi:hypothetical protein